MPSTRAVLAAALMLGPSLAGIARADFESKVVSDAANLFEARSVVTLAGLRQRVLINDATGEQILDIDHLLDPSDDALDGFAVFTLPPGGFSGSTRRSPGRTPP
jgi:hypothetical protein